MKYLKLFENHSSYNNKDLVVVDIQPEYEDGFGFSIYEFLEFINDNYELFNSITMLYNGYDTLGMINESEYTWWLIENGMNEEVLNYINFYDRGYAFFRYCIDSGIEYEVIINLIKYMIKKNINDSREIDSDIWNELIEFYKSMDVDMSDVRNLLENSGDMINIPDLMNELNYLSNNILLTGGSVEECLREVVIALKSLGKEYDILDEFTY